MFRLICILFVLCASTVASAQQYRPAPQPQLYQIQMVLRPAWPFGFRYVVRPVIVPVYPQQMPQQ